MESSMNNAFIMSEHETTFTSDQVAPEESSWTMYFEDFFEASPSTIDVGDCSSSSVSDAMSFVAAKKTLDTSELDGFSSKNIDIKRTKHREIPFGRHHHDLEDTASSPSRSPNVYSLMKILDNNRRHGDGIVVGKDTNNEKGEGAEGNQGGLLVDLEKRGLCLVPLSMVTNYLG